MEIQPAAVMENRLTSATAPAAATNADSKIQFWRYQLLVPNPKSQTFVPAQTNLITRRENK
jgi:hypothetical protein